MSFSFRASLIARPIYDLRRARKYLNRSVLNLKGIVLYKIIAPINKQARRSPHKLDRYREGAPSDDKLNSKKIALKRKVCNCFQSTITSANIVNCSLLLAPISHENQKRTFQLLTSPAPELVFQFKNRLSFNLNFLFFPLSRVTEINPRVSR